MEKIKYNRALVSSMVSFTISSMSFLLIPISNFDGTSVQRFLAYMVGIMFWFGLLIGLIINFILGKIRKNVTVNQYPIPGIFCFFKNQKGKFFDILMLSSLALLTVCKLMFADYSWIWIVMLTILVFSFFMHSVFNGNNYLFAVQKGVK